MTPWDFFGSASVSHHLWKQSVALKRFRARDLTCIDIWLARVTGGVHDEFWPNAAQEIDERFKARVVEFLASRGDKLLAAAMELLRKGLTDVPR